MEAGNLDDPDAGGQPVAEWAATSQASATQVMGVAGALGLTRRTGSPGPTILDGYGCSLEISSTPSGSFFTLRVDRAPDLEALRSGIEAGLRSFGGSTTADSLEDATRPARSGRAESAPILGPAERNASADRAAHAGDEATTPDACIPGAPAAVAEDNHQRLPAGPFSDPDVSDASVTADPTVAHPPELSGRDVKTVPGPAVSSALRLGGNLEILTGLLVLVGLISPMLKSFDARALANPAAWPILLMGTVILVAGVLATKGDRVALVTGGVVAMGFAAMQVFILGLLSLLSNLAGALGGTNAGLGIGLLSWGGAMILGAVAFMLALGQIGPDPGERDPGAGAAIASLIGAFAVAAGFARVGVGGDVVGRIVVASAPLLTATNIFFLAFPIAMTFTAIGGRSRASYGLAGGCGWFFGAVAGADVIRVLTNRSDLFSSAHPLDLILTAGGSAVLLVVGGATALARSAVPGGASDRGRAISPDETAGVTAALDAHTEPSSLTGHAPSLGIGVLAVVAAIVIASAGAVAANQSSASGSARSVTASRSWSSGSASSSTKRSATTATTAKPSNSSGTTTARPTTTVRRTTTTRPTTTRPPTTPVSSPVPYTLSSECRQTCKIYFRGSPFEDLSSPSETFGHDGDKVRVVCKTNGQMVRDGDSQRSSTTWDRLDDGTYVSDIYVGASSSSKVRPC